MKTAGMTLQQYARHHGVTERQIQTYMTRGLPVRRQKRKGGGRPRVIIDQVAADAWLIENGIVTKGMTEKASQQSVGSGVPTPTSTDDAYDRDRAKRYGIVGALERYRIIERTASNLLLKAYVERNGAVISVLQKQLPTLIAQLRQLELAALEYGTKAEELLPADQVKLAGHKVSQLFRNKLMTLGHAIVPRLAHFVKDQAHFPEIQTIIDNTVRDQLREFPENVFAT